MQAMERLQLLAEIVHCPMAAACHADARRQHSCATVVAAQHASCLSELQVPEPWSGHIEQAPLLFVASNPSIGTDDLFPRWGAAPVLLNHYFQERYEHYIDDGKRLRLAEGSATEAALLGYAEAELPRTDDQVRWGRSVQYWAEVKGRAHELVGHAVRPGRDYAITEVVHCKSLHEHGVNAALPACTERYLERVLRVAAASVIALMGETALRAMRHAFPEARIPRGPWGPAQLAGLERYVIYLDRPGSNRPRKLAACYPDHLPTLQAFIKAHMVDMTDSAER
jgi:hypothetical protein